MIGVWVPLSQGKLQPEQPELVLFLRMGCPFCEKSIPLYKDILDSVAVKSNKVHVVVIMPNKEDEAIKYLRDNKLPVHRLAADVKLDTIGVASVPTVVILRDGKMVTGWNGYQDHPEEVLKEVNKL